MWPGENIRVACNANVNGTNVNAPDEFVTVLPDQTITLNFVLPTPPMPTTGAISGIMETPGPLTPFNLVIAKSLKTFSALIGEDGPYSIEGIPSRTYTVKGQTNFNNARQIFFHPIGSYSPATTDRKYVVTAGATTEVNISTTQEFLTGRVNITGSAPFSDLNLLEVEAIGVSNTETQWGETRDRRADITSGDYELVVSKGPWSIDNIHMKFSNSSSDPAEYINENLNFRDRIVEQNPITGDPWNTKLRPAHR